MWPLSSKRIHSQPRMPYWTNSPSAGVSSSWRPEGEQGGQADLAEAVADVPVLEAADDVELARLVHRLVDLATGAGKGAADVLGPGGTAADVALVEDVDRRQVGRVGGGAGGLGRQQRLPDRRRQLLAQPVRLDHPEHPRPVSWR
jgi:hypothetical protein